MIGRYLQSLAVVVGMVVALASPTRAAVIVNAANVGYNFSIDYAGQVGGAATPQLSALGDFTFTGLTNNGLTYNFDYALTNDSTTTARLSGFGFNTNPNASNAVVTGAFNNSYISGNYPEGFGTVDVCFTDSGGSCAGGGNGGFYNPDVGTGSFALTFAQVMNAVTFDSFVTRFQSISGVSGGTSGIGIGSVVQGSAPITAPEPATWLMMMGGFGLMGWAIRRERAVRRIPARC